MSFGTGGVAGRAVTAPGAPVALSLSPDFLVGGGTPLLMRGEGERDSVVFLKPDGAEIFVSPTGDRTFDTNAPLHWSRPAQVADAGKWDVRAGDIDNDKRDDLVFLPKPGDGSTVWIAFRLANGNFADVVVSGDIPKICTTGAVDIAALTSSGQGDLFCATSTHLYVSTWLGAQGFGLPTESPFDITDRAWNAAPALFDIDGDDLEDYATWLDGHIWYRLNNGKRAFGSVRRIDLPLDGIPPNDFAASFVFAKPSVGGGRPWLFYAGPSGAGSALVGFGPTRTLK